jgi:hypothetical protein
MTSNVSLSYPNRCDECSITETGSATWQTNLPLTNIQNKVIKRVARTDIGKRTSELKINFPYESRSIGVVSVINHNFTTNAKVRFIGYSGLNFTGDVRFDSGSNFRAWTILYPIYADGAAGAKIPWESTNWFLGSVEKEQRDSYTSLATFYPPKRTDNTIDLPNNNNYTVRSVKIIIDDTPSTPVTSSTSVTVGTGSKIFIFSTGLSFIAGQEVTIYKTSDNTTFVSGKIQYYDSATGSLILNATMYGGTGSHSAWSCINGDNYLEIGRIFLGRTVEPRINPEYGDIQQGYVDLTEIQRSIDNTKYFYVKPKMRTLSCVFKSLSQDEAFSGFYDAQREVGLSGELLYTYSKPDYIGDINMTVDKNFYARTFLCNFSELSPIDNPFVGRFQTALKLEEIV